MSKSNLTLFRKFGEYFLRLKGYFLGGNVYVRKTGNLRLLLIMGNERGAPCKGSINGEKFLEKDFDKFDVWIKKMISSKRKDIREVLMGSLPKKSREKIWDMILNSSATSRVN